MEETGTVLLAFSDRMVSEYVESILTVEGYRVLHAGTLLEVVDVLDRFRVDLLIAGERLPGVSMTALLPLIRERYEQVKVVIAMKRYSPRLELCLRPYKILYVMPWPVSGELLKSVVSRGVRAA
jgi:DNA-binding NtrC family response regulator